MDATLTPPGASLAGAGAGGFPWLGLLVLWPAAAALLLPLLPGDSNDPRLPRTVALVTLALDFALMLWVFARHFDGASSSLQPVSYPHLTLPTN